METTNRLFCVAILCAVFCFAWSIQDKIKVLVPPATLQLARQKAEVCGKENGVPAAHLKKIIDKTLPNDRPNMLFFQCVVENTGHVDKDGHFIYDVMSEFKVVNGTQDDYMKYLEECNKISMGENIETLSAMADCFHKNYFLAVEN